MTWLRCVITVALCLAALAGCQDNLPPPPGTVTQAKALSRDTEAARRHNDQALKLMDCQDCRGAEKELKLAIAADEFFGPAHNNLGSLYFRQKQYYLAGLEFQSAATYLPKEPGPRTNIGMVFEAVGKLDDAEMSNVL